MITQIAIVIILLLLVRILAFFTSSETAFLSISKITLRQMIDSNQPKAKLIGQLKAQMDKLLSTVLIGTNFINTLATSLATALAIDLAGQDGVAIATGIMTVIIVIFGETLPKTMAAWKPVEKAQGSAATLLFLEKILTPVIAVFTFITDGLAHAAERLWQSDEPEITEDELRALFEVGDEEGTLEENEKELLNKIIEFNDMRVRDICRHRSLVKTINEDAGFEETRQAFISSGFSRLPVLNSASGSEETGSKSITGLVHYKSVLFWSGSRATFKAKNVMRPVLFIPETVPVETLLKRFRTTRQSFAVVVDEHGSNAGIVTMVDIMRAVFGHMTDEYTEHHVQPEQRIRMTGKSEFLIPGDMLITDINTSFALNLQSEECDTIGGWLLEQFGYLPETGEKLKVGNRWFIVEEQSARRIQNIRIRYDKDTSQPK